MDSESMLRPRKIISVVPSCSQKTYRVGWSDSTCNILLFLFCFNKVTAMQVRSLDLQTDWFCCSKFEFILSSNFSIDQTKENTIRKAEKTIFLSAILLLKICCYHDPGTSSLVTAS